MKRFMHNGDGRTRAEDGVSAGDAEQNRQEAALSLLSDMVGPESSRVYAEWGQGVEHRLRMRLISASQEGSVTTRPRLFMRAPSGRRRILPRGHPVIALVVALVLVSTALAVANVANLGAPTNDAPGASQPLDGFHRLGPILRSHEKVEMLVFETLWDGGSAVDRWPIVKALEQFGSWTNLAKGTTTEPLPQNRSQPGYFFSPGKGSHNPGVPTFDLSRAQYQSPYVAFVRRVLQVHSHTPIARLSPAEEALFQRVLHMPQLQSTQYPLPVVVVGGYGMHGAIDDPTYVLFNTSIPGASEFQSFDTIQQAMQSGDSKPGLGFLVREFNVYANVMTALICHADRNRPSSVCQRPAIRIVLKQLK